MILDMDGLLVDCEPLQFAALSRVLHDQHGLTLPHEVIVSLIGRRNREVAAYVRERYALPEDIDELVAAQIAYYEPLLRDDVNIMPGARELVEHVAALACALAIASSSPLRQIRIVSERLSLNNILAAVALGGRSVAW